jgi:hypothetical protein
MELEYKRVPFDLRELKAVDDGGWEIAGYASTWGGPPDAYGDVVARGAFADSITERATKFLYEHHTPIGKQLEIREDDHGLYGRWSIVDTTAGTDAYKLAKAGVLDSLSIGFLTDAADYAEDGTRTLRKITLVEVSAVAIPANSKAVITAVKRSPQLELSSSPVPPDPEPDPPAPAPSISFDFDDVRRCLVALGCLDHQEVAS